jgi:hypothetical protein
MEAKKLLAEAARLVSTDRAKTHGPKLENHLNISSLWSAYLGVEIKPAQAAMMMALLKIARTKAGEKNNDDYVDAAAYISIASEISRPERDSNSIRKQNEKRRAAE